MTWKVVDTKTSVHVIPTHDWHPHILRRCCECTPAIEYADPVNGKKHPKPLIKHRDELDRIEKINRNDRPDNQGDDRAI